MMIWRLYQMNTMNQAISEIGVVPVIKLNNPERDAAPLAKALCAGGVPVAEVTFRAAGAPLAIKVMKETCPDMIVGAGTVTTAAQIDEAIEAGAQFIVTPGMDEELVKYAPGKEDCNLSGLHDTVRLPHCTEVWSGSAEVLPS